MHKIYKAILPTPQKMIPRYKALLLASGAKPLYRIIVQDNTDEIVHQAVLLLTGKICQMSAVDYGNAEGYEIRIMVAPESPRLAPYARADAYYIDADESGTTICGYDTGAIYRAVTTFIQMLFTENDCLYIALASIDDWPDFPHRGVYIESRYGSEFLTLEDWIRAIDYFAEMKYNIIRIAVYGCWCVQYDGVISEYLYLPLKNFPKLSTPKQIKYYSATDKHWVFERYKLPTMFTEDFFGDIICYAKARGVTVSPQFNSFGHNTLLPRCYPEISAKDENGQLQGYGLCTSDERTYVLLYQIFDEIIDRYLAPNGIDSIIIGLDEIKAYNGQDPDDIFNKKSPYCQCSHCRGKSQTEIVIEHCIKLCKHLKKRGMRNISMYHDVLFEVNDVPGEEFAQMLRENELDDVVVIDWWNYNEESRLFGGKKTHSYCRSTIKPTTGYFHWILPNEYESNICGCAKIAREMGYEGMEAYTLFEYCYDRNYRYLSQLCWNTSRIPHKDDFHESYACKHYPNDLQDAMQALSQMRDIMASVDYCTPELLKLDYYNYSYVQDGQPYPRRFPEELFEKLLEKKDWYLEYFNHVKTKSEEALTFFKKIRHNGNTEQWINDAWLLTALTYYTVCEEYIVLLGIHGIESEPGVLLSKIDNLIRSRELLMRTVENTRIKATQYQCLRDMTIYRQILLDLHDIIALHLGDKKIRIDLTRLDAVKSPIYYFLR